MTSDLAAMRWSKDTIIRCEHTTTLTNTLLLLNWLVDWIFQTIIIFGIASPVLHFLLFCKGSWVWLSQSPTQRFCMAFTCQTGSMTSHLRTPPWRTFGNEIIIILLIDYTFNVLYFSLLVFICSFSYLIQNYVSYYWRYDLIILFHLKVKCGVRGETHPGCNAVGMIDRSLLGIQHLYTRPVYLKTTVCGNANRRNIH